MKSKFLNRLDHDKIVKAIRKVEKNSTGEIRVQVTQKRFFLFQDEMKFARRSFAKLGMHQTPERNGVLLVVFPAIRKIVILGDEGIDSRIGQPFWEKTVEDAVANFKAEQFTTGIVQAIEVVGEVLITHFPQKGKNQDNVHSDDVVEN